MADQQKVIYGLSNGAVFSDLEQHLKQFSRSRYSLTLNFLQMAKDPTIVSIKCEQEIVPKLTNGTISNDLEWLGEIFNDTKHRAVSLL